MDGIDERATDWAYSLPDGVNTPRQLADLAGEVTLSGRYTPWGDILDVYGTGSFTFGYLGGMMDLSSGLIYVGNGQYYDPSTGRFLTRDAKPNNSNPYVPWDPTGSLLGPLGLLALVYGKKRRCSKWDILLIIILIGITTGMSVIACTPVPATPLPSSNTPPTPIPTQTPVPGEPGTSPSNPTSTPMPPITLTLPECPTAPLDDELHITFLGDLAHMSLYDYLKNVDPPVLLLARVAIGEAVHNSSIDRQIFMWTVKARIEMGFQNYHDGEWVNGPKPKTDIKTELLLHPKGWWQYAVLDRPGQGAIDFPWEATAADAECSTNWRRMMNPCDGTDTQALKDAYSEAQRIMSQDIREMPEAIQGYDSNLAPGSGGLWCDYGDKIEGYTKPATSFYIEGDLPSSKYYDCVAPDNIIFFGAPPATPTS